MQTTKRVQNAARKFFAVLCPGTPWGEGWVLGDIQMLVLSAFLLNDLSWKGQDLAGWQYPYLELAEGGKFEGNQTWAVLLRQAYKLARPFPTTMDLAGARVAAADVWYEASDLNGHQIKDAGAWLTGTLADEIVKVLEIEEYSQQATVRKHKLVVRFVPGTTTIEQATIDGELVDGSKMVAAKV